MSKIIVSDSSQDPFRNALGSSRTVVDKGDGTNIISFSGNKTLKMEVISKSIDIDGDNYAERTRIRIKPNSSSDNFENTLTSAIRVGIDYFDHFITLPKITQKQKGIVSGEGGKNSVYNCQSVYNYSAPKYEEFYNLQKDTSLPPVFSQVSKEEFHQGKAALFYKPGSGQQNIVYPEKKELNSKKKLDAFPFYNRIDFATEVKTSFCEFTKKVGVFDNILRGYLKYLQGSPTTVSFNIQNDQTLNENVEVPVFDINAWIKNPNPENIDRYYSLNQASATDSAMIKQYKKLLLAGYVNKISLGNFRSFEDIIRGKESYKEDFVFSIEKGRNSIVNKLQTFFLPANKNIFGLNDTQVKYGQKYVYKCNAHYIIIGNKYRYENFEIVQNTGTREAYLEVVNSPNVVMVPIDVFEKNIYVVQSPPMVPEVKFVTENNSSKVIQIYFTSKKGKQHGQFLPVFTTDQMQQEMLSNNYSDNIMFQEYKDSALFEMYASDTAPKSYSDFSKITDIRMSYRTTDAMYNLKVKPNRTVYYMFRKKNERGLVSNPTPIYEVKLIVDADDSSISVKTYSFPKEITYQESRKFQSLFQVKPAYEQITFVEDQPYLVNKDSLKGTMDNIYLGPNENSIWGRKIKFRFKSTTTGKILDYNITFKLTKNKTEEDF